MANLEMDRWSSKCGDCHLPADPGETGHYTNLGYNSTLNGTPGCGAEWTSWSFPYILTQDSLASIFDRFPHLRNLSANYMMVGDL